MGTAQVSCCVGAVLSCIGAWGGANSPRPAFMLLCLLLYFTPSSRNTQEHFYSFRPYTANFSTCRVQHYRHSFFWGQTVTLKECKRNRLPQSMRQAILLIIATDYLFCFHNPNNSIPSAVGIWRILCSEVQLRFSILAKPV